MSRTDAQACTQNRAGEHGKAVFQPVAFGSGVSWGPGDFLIEMNATEERLHCTGETKKKPGRRTESGRALNMKMYANV
jgi:hypothetical protein